MPQAHKDLGNAAQSLGTFGARGVRQIFLTLQDFWVYIARNLRSALRFLLQPPLLRELQADALEPLELVDVLLITSLAADQTPRRAGDLNTSRPVAPVCARQHQTG
jgi:hypothetical protein